MRNAIMTAGLTATAIVVALATGQARAQTAERTQQIAEELARKMAQQRAARGRMVPSPQASASIPSDIPGEDMYTQRSTEAPIGGQAVPPSKRAYDLPSVTYRSLTESLW